jgi:ribosomal protein S18 acetylase RimI-like enzyme
VFYSKQIAMESFHVERWQPDNDHLTADVVALGKLLHDCVHGGASVSFILPFSRDEAAAFWRDKVFPTVHAGTCCVLIARRTNGSSVTSDDQIVGTVQLDLATPPNQPHRGEIKKLLVHPAARRAGIARALMLALEDHARDAERTLLTLDTASEAAERLYASLGYVRAGVIPGFSIRPDSRELEATTVMYKQLANNGSAKVAINGPAKV